MNTIYDFFLLCGFYLLSVGLFIALLHRTYQKSRFSFHLLFSLMYLVTFYAGFPLSLLMAFGFGYQLPHIESQWQVFIVSGGGYLIYYWCYGFFSFYKLSIVKEAREIAIFQAKMTACILAVVAISALLCFFYLNGFLLFKLEKYSQLFAKDVVTLAGLKRFFYFLLPSLLIVFFITQSRKAWWMLLIMGGLFGILTYITVGGTRANLALAFAFFFLIGLYQGYLPFSAMMVAAVMSVITMFFLALARYKLDVSGSEAIYTFLYLSRDTFSPWENLARLLSYNNVEYQGLMPIIRDFYVYIPQALWQERPEIAWNTANYYTKVILANQSGLAISPTLLGSFYIMGGFWFIIIGMVIIGGMIKALDDLFLYGKTCNSPLIQAYCFGNLFNLIVLVREGIDAFASRLVFFSIVFLAGWLIAKWISGREKDDR